MVPLCSRLDLDNFDEGKGLAALCRGRKRFAVERKRTEFGRR